MVYAGNYSQAHIRTVVVGSQVVTRTKTFTLDLIISNRITKTFTLDLIIKKVNTKTFTLDLITKKTFTKTFTLDLLTLKTSTKNFTLDLLTRVTNIKTFKLDLITESTAKPKSFTLDLITLATNTKNFTLDLITFKTTGGEADGSEWWGEPFKKTSWIKTQYHLGLTVAFEIGKEPIIEKIQHTTKLPLQLEIIKKYMKDVGLTAQIVSDRATRYSIVLDVTRPEKKSIKINTEINHNHNINNTFSAELLDTIENRQKPALEELALRNLDLQYLLEHPDKIRGHPNKRLAKLALRLLNEDNDE